MFGLSMLTYTVCLTSSVVTSVQVQKSSELTDMNKVFFLVCTVEYCKSDTVLSNCRYINGQVYFFFFFAFLPPFLPLRAK